MHRPAPAPHHCPTPHYQARGGMKGEAGTLRFVIHELSCVPLPIGAEDPPSVAAGKRVSRPERLRQSNLCNAIFLIDVREKCQLCTNHCAGRRHASVLWAGATQRRARTAPPSRLVLSVELDRFGYEMHCGRPMTRPLPLFSLELQEGETPVIADQTADEDQAGNQI